MAKGIIHVAGRLGMRANYLCVGSTVSHAEPTECLISHPAQDPDEPKDQLYAVA